LDAVEQRHEHAVQGGIGLCVEFAIGKQVIDGILDLVDTLDGDGLWHVAHLVVRQLIKGGVDPCHAFAQGRIGGIAHFGDARGGAGHGMRFMAFVLMLVLGQRWKCRDQQNGQRQGRQSNDFHGDLWMIVENPDMLADAIGCRADSDQHLCTPPYARLVHMLAQPRRKAARVQVRWQFERPDSRCRKKLRMNATRPPSIRDLRGLSADEAARRLAANGPNMLPGSSPKSLLKIVAGVLVEPMFLMLLVAGGLYLALGDTAEAIFLLGSVLVVIGITLIQEGKTQRALESLRDLSAPRALVMRDGEELRIAGRDVVIGDLLVLHEGDRIAADATLIDGQLDANESLLTGEAVPVSK